jgi:hypothetical protein
VGFHEVNEVFGFIASLITFGQLAWQAYRWRRRQRAREDSHPADLTVDSSPRGALSLRLAAGLPLLFGRTLAASPVVTKLKSKAFPFVVWAGVVYLIYFVALRPTTGAMVFREIGGCLTDPRILIPLGVLLAGTLVLTAVPQRRLPVELHRVARWLKARMTAEPLAAVNATVRLVLVLLLLLTLLIRPHSLAVVVGGFWSGVADFFGGIADFLSNLVA